MKPVKLQALEIPTQNHFSASFINDPAWAIQMWVIPEGGWMGGGMREGRGAGVSPMWDGTGEGGVVRLPAGGRRASLARAVLRLLVALGTQAPACQSCPWSWGLHAGHGPLQVSAPRCDCKAFQGKCSFCFTVSVWLRKRERNCCYTNTSNYMGFVFTQLLAFWNILWKKSLPWLYYSPKPRFCQTLCTINLQKLHNLLKNVQCTNKMFHRINFFVCSTKT